MKQRFKEIMERALAEGHRVPCDLDTYHEGLLEMLDVFTDHLDKAKADESKRPSLTLEMVKEKGDVFTLARETFNAYAGMDVPALPTDPQQALQVELVRWVNTKLPKNDLPANVSNVLGINEEIGEMAQAVLGILAAFGRINHATLKHSQGLRGYGDVDKLRRAVLDAGCDASIFLIQLFTTIRCDYWTAVNATSRLVLERDWKARPTDAHTVNEAGA